MDKRLKDLSDYRLEQAGRCIKSAKILALDSDYDDYYVLSKEKVEEQIENAEKFFHIIEEYLKKKKDE